ncbi:MAG: cyclase family protein [Chloroflexi bacterium]|nr:cyclase family protein [Chloroflexota bacterium]
MSSNDIPQPGRLSPYGRLPVPQLTPELLRLVGTGTVYSLSVNYYEGMPKPVPMVPYTISARNRHGDLKGIEPATFAAESITMAAHTGTHIDALCHIGERQDRQGRPSNEGEPRLYASQGETVPAAESASHQGLLQMNIAQMPPILARAVLLDVAGLKGMDVLPDAYMITVEDLEATIAKQGTMLQPGTAVLLRTGFYHHLASGNPTYVDQIAGPGLAAAQFLVDQGMILIGADNMSVEAMPPMDHAVHRYLLVHNGITHLENLYLEELAEKQIYEFLLIVTPLRLIGATGSWVHPIAIA